MEVSMRDRVYRIPSRIDQKGVLADITDLHRYLDEERVYIQHVCDYLVALERAYRTCSQSLAEPKGDIFEDLPSTSAFVAFRQFRLDHCARLGAIAQQLNQVNTTDFSPVNTSFQAIHQRLKTELKTLSSLIQAPLDILAASIAGYDKFFRQLQQFLVNPQQAGKAVRSLDEKLGRIWSNYAAYHNRWIEYCTAREPVFAMIEAAVDRTNAQIRQHLQAASAIDGDVVGDVTLPPEPEKAADDSPEEQDVGPGERFPVVLAQPLVVAGVQLKVNTQMVVVDSAGDRWKVRDQVGRVWTIPQMFLSADMTAK
jgi:hypothetical protein